MEPNITLNFLAIAAAVLAQFVLGFLWYGPLFGRAWAKEVGLNFEEKPPAAAMVKSMLLMIVGSFLTAYVLAHSTEVWRGSAWGSAIPDKPAYVYGFFAGFFTWLGFYIPMLLSSVAWEQKSWKLFAINACYHLLALQAVGQILAFWQ